MWNFILTLQTMILCEKCEKCEKLGNVHCY